MGRLILMALGASIFVTVVGALAPTLRAAGPVPAELIAATEQVERGKILFQTHCASCHGPQGEGTTEAPRIIADPHPLKGHKTAQALFDFVSKEMPASTPGSLKAEEYWDVLAFILDANKLLPAETTLGPANAGTIKVGD